MVMAARMIGSSFATTAAEVVALKMLHALEVPFLLVGAFKYITGVFDVACRRRFTWWFPVFQTGGGDLSLRVCREYV
jgi:oligosaccharide:H+ symporter